MGVRRGQVAFAGTLVAANFAPFRFSSTFAFPALEAPEITWTEKRSQPCAHYGHRFHSKKLPEGLRYCREFITSAEEDGLDQLLSDGPWLRHIKSRAQQFFGLVTTHELPALQPSHPHAENEARPLQDVPDWLMQRVFATGVFPRNEVNQVAANEYLDRAGISSHVEEPTSFGPNLATLSMLSPVEMTLTPAEEDWSLLLLQGESRYGFRHGIRRSKLVRLADGQQLRRGPGYRRVSLTFRELLPSRRQLADVAFRKSAWATSVLFGPTSLISLPPPRSELRGGRREGEGDARAHWLPRPREVPAFFIPKTSEDKVQIAAEAAAISLLAMVPKVSTGRLSRPSEKMTLHRFAAAMPAERPELAALLRRPPSCAESFSGLAEKAERERERGKERGRTTR
eukprot:g7447.t1